MPEPPIRERRPPQFTLASLFVVMAVVALLLGLLVPGIPAAREAALRTQCTNNLKQVGFALHNYHDTWKVIPPARTPDGQGRPVHGWRILVQPYLEASPYYALYHSEEPWDGRANLPLHGVDHHCHACPSDTSRPIGIVSCLAVVGDQTVWPAEKCSRLADFKDGSSNSLLVVEASKSAIHWLEPRDLEFNDFDYAINSRSGRGIRSEHRGGANVLYADGAVGWLSHRTSPDVLRALLTIAGGEEFPEDWTR